MVIKNGTCPMPPEGGKTAAVPVTPVISVRSVNGEIGDVVLRKLVVGEKEYNGFERIEIKAEDLGLNKALKFVKEVDTVDHVKWEISHGEIGDLFFCKEDTLFYFSTGEGMYKTFGAGEHFDAFAKASESASKIVAHINEDFELTLDLLDRDGNKFFTSEPVVIPFEFSDIIKNGYYDAATKELVFVLKNDKEIRIPVSGLISGLQKEITDENKLAFRLVEGLNDFKVDIYDKLNAEISARADADSAEVVARNNAIAAEATQRIAADNDEKSLREQADTAEQNARIAADTTIRTDLSSLTTQFEAEVIARQEGDNVNDAHLQLEVEQRKAKDSELETKLNTEIATRTAETTALRGDLNAEISNRITAINEVTTNLNTERNNRISNDAAIRADLTSEVNTREAAVNTLTANLTAETTARVAADDVLTKLFNDEVRDRAEAVAQEKREREAADTILQSNIDTERNNRISNDNLLKVDIESEASTRLSKDNEILDSLAEERRNRIGNDETLQTNINNEKSLRESADANLQAQIDATPIYGMIKDDDPGQYASVYHLTKQIPGQEPVNIGTPIAVAKDFLVKSATLKTVTEEGVPYPGAKVGDKYIDFVINSKDAVDPSKEEHIYLPVQDLVDIYTGGYGITVEGYQIRLSDDFTHRVITIEENLTTERNNRIAQDKILTDNLNAEIATRTSEDAALKTEYTAKISEEAGLRASADAGIINDYTSKISEEASSRASADAGIINNYTSLINTETQNRISGDTELTNLITAQITNEQQVRQATDVALQNQITANKATLDQEIIDRTTSDAALQAAINAILAHRENYSTSIIGDGSTKSFTVTHGLGTSNVIVQLYDVSNGTTVLTDVTRDSANTVVVTFKEAPVSNKVYTVMCYGIVSNAQTVELTFLPNGGTGTMSKKAAVVGAATTMPACAFMAPSGYEFDCWALGSTTGTHVNAGDTAIFTEATNIYAIWKVCRGTFYYGSVDKQTCLNKSADALLQMTSTNKSATELITTGYSSTFSNGVPTFAVSTSLAVQFDYFWTGSETYTGEAYMFTADGFNFYCNINDEGEPGYVFEETPCGIKFKSI